MRNLLRKLFGCAFGHKWKYATPVQEGYRLVDHWRGQIVPDSDGVHTIQHRHCETCGKVGKRVVELEGI